MSVWVGGSVDDVKPYHAVLPPKKITLTLLPASPRPNFRPFVWMQLMSYGAIGQKERWTPMASYRAEWVKEFTSLFLFKMLVSTKVPTSVSMMTLLIYSVEYHQVP